MKVKNYIKRIRQEKGIARYTLSRLTGLNWHTLHKIEEGGDFKVSSLLLIAKSLDVLIAELVKEEV